MTPDQESLLDDLLAVESGLTARQMDFLEDLDSRWRERELSEKQEEWLNHIAEKVGLLGG